jgi:N-acetylglutamate synthase-like GNAT family acetyltransferase
MAESANVSGGIRIRGARAEDLSIVAQLLAAARLVPIDDSAQFGPRYAVAEEAAGDVGVAGYERYGTDILLRSVVVVESCRSRGLGAALIEDRLAHARNAGCLSAYLLTDTAKSYWKRNGFEAIERSGAPAAIMQSQEWRHACPASATAMRRSLILY